MLFRSPEDYGTASTIVLFPQHPSSGGGWLEQSTAHEQRATRPCACVDSSRAKAHIGRLLSASLLKGSGNCTAVCSTTVQPCSSESAFQLTSSPPAKDPHRMAWGGSLSKLTVQSCSSVQVITDSPQAKPRSVLIVVPVANASALPTPVSRERSSAAVRSSSIPTRSAQPSNVPSPRRKPCRSAAC